MGSLFYFLEELDKEMRITINPEEAKYIATCVCPKSSPSYKKIMEIRSKLNYSINNSSTIELKPSEIFYAFPTLAPKIIYEGIPTLRYFESMEDSGHNQTLIKTLIKMITSNTRLKGTKVLKSLIDHAYDCSVQLGKFEDGKIKIWSPSGIREMEVDRRYIASMRDCSYFTTHGKNENGLRIAIRRIEDPEIIEDLKKLEELWKPLSILEG